MNQQQIENLSTEEYSYFLAYGHCQKEVVSPTIGEIVELFLDEESDCADERRVPQGIEDVCSLKRYDSIGGVLQDAACTYTQRSTCE